MADTDYYELVNVDENDIFGRDSFVGTKKGQAILQLCLANRAQVHFFPLPLLDGAEVVEQRLNEIPEAMRRARKVFLGGMFLPPCYPEVSEPGASDYVLKRYLKLLGKAIPVEIDKNYCWSSL